MLELIDRSTAKAKGLRHYFTGKSCVRNHRSPRFVSNTHCVECSKVWCAEGYVRHKQVRNAKTKRYYEDNKSKAIADANAWSKAHPEYRYEKRARRRAAEAEASFSKHRAEIRLIYKNRPEGMVVDHVIPLRHPLVCGLHVPWNMQYLIAKENLVKGNYFTPFHLQ